MAKKPKLLEPSIHRESCVSCGVVLSWKIIKKINNKNKIKNKKIQN
jgi:hypothetical protein